MTDAISSFVEESLEDIQATNQPDLGSQMNTNQMASNIACQGLDADQNDSEKNQGVDGLVEEKEDPLFNISTLLTEPSAYLRRRCPLCFSSNCCEAEDTL
jgi:hypothetical protein